MYANDSHMFEAVVFDTIETCRHPDTVREIRQLLASCQLGMDDDIEMFVVGRMGGTLVACAGLATCIIKCVAVDPTLRDLNLGGQIVNEMVQQAAQRGVFHLFLYTKPENKTVFRACGFYPLAQYEDTALLMENTPIGIKQYCQSLAAQRQPGQAIGSIVMNANPFTLGHRYLVEQAAQACDWLHVFVVREDVSFFPFSERLAMVQEGVAQIPNLTVHPGSAYMISKATFPGYFLKEEKVMTQAHAALDLLIFRRYIAPALGINQRFVGTEPFCPVTRQYNQDMHIWLEEDCSQSAPALRVIEIERRCQQAGRAISASEVRALLKQGLFSAIQQIVPASTLQHLQHYYEPAYG